VVATVFRNVSKFYLLSEAIIVVHGTGRIDMSCRHWRVCDKQRWLSRISSLQQHWRKFHMHMPVRIQRKWNRLHRYIDVHH